MASTGTIDTPTEDEVAAAARVEADWIVQRAHADIAVRQARGEVEPLPPPAEPWLAGILGREGWSDIEKRDAIVAVLGEQIAAEESADVVEAT